MARFRRGTMFLNRYVLLEPIGQGSVTVVYQADDTLNNRQVAVKLLEPSLADNRRAQERMRRPVEIMSLLADPGVPRVYEAGTAPLGDGSALAYCVMELLTGEALDSRLARGPLPWLQATRVAATIADVLTLAHAQSIALRVLGPTGVLLTADGAKIVDFDAAMVVVPPPPAPAPPPTGSGGSGRRRSAAPAPRPDRGAVAIATLAAEDVYALGCLLDQMIGGTGPGAGLPAPLVELLLRCLSEPVHRPDAATLSMELWGMLTPGMPPPSSTFEDGPLSVPMSLNAAPGRHSAAVAALESRSSVEAQIVDAYPSDSYASDSYPDSFASDSYGTSSYGAEAYATSPYGGEDHDASPDGAPPYDASFYGTDPYAAQAYESYAAEPASAESAAQARGALARAALDRSRQDHPVEQIAYRSTVDGGTAGASLLDASSPVAPALLGGRTSARGGRAGLAGASGGGTQGGATSGGRASRMRGAAGSAVAAAVNGRAAAVDATGAAGTVDDTHGDIANDGSFAGAGHSIMAESDDARFGVFAGSDTIAGNGTGAVSAASDSRIPVSRDRERAAGPQQVPVGHSGQGGRHRRRRPAWTAPTGQANALS